MFLYCNGLPLMFVSNAEMSHPAAICASVIVSYFLLGVDDVAVQIEEPFDILPMLAIEDGIRGTVDVAFDSMLRE